jgi:hypothetical protein
MLKKAGNRKERSREISKQRCKKQRRRKGSGKWQMKKSERDKRIGVG